MARVAIVGAGNLGTYLGTELKRAGHEVFFCLRHAHPNLRFPVFFKHPPAADIVLLTVKTFDTKAALAWLPQLCKDQQPVAVIQNGIGHAERVAPYRAIPVLSYVYVETQNGEQRAFLPPNRAPFTIPSISACNPFADLFAYSSLQIEREGAFHTAAWKKMLHNCVSNALTTLAGQGLEILQEPTYHEMAQWILSEGIQIAQAAGAHLRADEDSRILGILSSYPPGTRTSMLQDFVLGKPLELDALNGTLIELGREYEIPTPMNERVVAQIKALMADRIHRV